MLPAGIVLNRRYRVIRLLASGGMGLVYLAEDVHWLRMWAVKAMSMAGGDKDNAFQGWREQFLQEATLLAELDHPNLPKVADFFEQDGTQYLVMEYIEGETLAETLERFPQGLPEAVVVAYAKQMCAALDYLHNRQHPIIFRDLKPDNVMVTPAGTIKLIDFGVARVHKQNGTNDTTQMGTMGYAPPEQYKRNGQTDVRSDIYALGATLHHLLTGRDPSQEVPFVYPSLRSLNQQISPTTERVVMRALAYRREERWPTVRELRMALTPRQTNPNTFAKSLEKLEPSPTPPKIRSSRPTTRLLDQVAQFSRRQLIGGGLGLLAIILVGIWFLAPYLQAMAWFWNNVALIGLVGPFSFAAIRRRGAMGLAQATVALAGGQLVSLRIGYQGDFANLVAGALASALLMEFLVAYLPTILAGRRRDDPGAWQRELLWLMVIAVLGHILLHYLAGVSRLAFNPLSWVITTVLATLGWFLGDLIQGYFYWR